MNNNIDCELDFLKNDSNRICCMVGAKGSSKTYTMLNLIKFYLLQNRFKTYHLILPAYKNDNDQEQYEFLKHTDKKAKILIYTKYSPLVLENIINKSDKKNQQLVVIDDGTQYGNMLNESTFTELITTSRHLKITLFFITHSMKSVMTPKVRANIDYLFIYRITNDKLLRGSVYEEFFSMLPDFKDYNEFKHFYYNKILKDKYNGLFLDVIDNKYCDNIKYWAVNTVDLDSRFNIKSHKINEIDVNPTTDIMLQKMENKEIRKKIENKFVD